MSAMAAWIFSKEFDLFWLAVNMILWGGEKPKKQPMAKNELYIWLYLCLAESELTQYNFLVLTKVKEAY